jgi:hypothetical protein
MVLHKFVFVTNIVFKSQKKKWPQGKDLVQIMVGFKNICGLPLIYGAIDYTQIHIQKPEGACATNFFSYKSKGHNMQLQVVVNHEKHFQNVFVGMLGSINDLRIIQLSNLCQRPTFQTWSTR